MSSYKRSLCFHFMKNGKCDLGANCNLAHGNRELRSYENPLYKAQLCTAYEQGGMCQMADDCLFAHGDEEMRNDDVQMSSIQPQIQRLSLSPDSENGSIKIEKEKKGGFKSALCMHFSKHGSCHMGIKCTFAHGKEDLINIKAPDTTDPKYKTKLCLRFAQDNFCPSGDFCVFAHGEAELRGSVDDMSKRSPLYKTTLCHNFATLGVCPSGRNCAFAHGRYELRPAGFDGDFEAKIQENPKWKCSLCKIYAQTGHCNKQNCDFAHGEDELRTETAENPRIIRSNYKTVLCNNYQQSGYCYHEDTCTFAHGDEELQKFSGGRDVASALKIIRGGAVSQSFKKRPSTAGGHSGSGMSSVMQPQPQSMNFQTVQSSVSNEHKLFVEFLEFKKFKEQTENSGMFNASMQSRFNQLPSQQPQTQTMMGTYDPLKVYNNATGRQVAVTELMGAANRSSVCGRSSGGGYGGSARMNIPRSRGGSNGNYGLNSISENYSGQAQQEMDYY